MLGIQPNVLVTSKQDGFTSVADLVAAAKAKPGTLTFASAGIGSSSHMAGERLRLAANIDVRDVLFRDTGLTEVMAGRIDFYFIPLAAAASALGSGKLDELAVSSPRRVAVLPNVPSSRRDTPTPYSASGSDYRRLRKRRSRSSTSCTTLKRRSRIRRFKKDWQSSASNRSR
jgi:Tripartite tricarboxylate transporter family receptor